MGLDRGATVDEYFEMLCQLGQGVQDKQMERFLSEYAAKSDTDEALKQAIRLWNDMRKEEANDD